MAKSTLMTKRTHNLLGLIFQNIFALMKYMLRTLGKHRMQWLDIFKVLGILGSVKAKVGVEV